MVPDAALGPMTWYGIGGRADLLVRPNTTEALATLAARCHRTGTPMRVFGGGANLLVGDDGVDGIVLRRALAVSCPEARLRSTLVGDPESVALLPPSR